MLIMRKMTGRFFWIIILALIIHCLILLFLFSAKYKVTKKSSAPVEKTVTIERVPSAQQYDLPNMLPGQIDKPTPVTAPEDKEEKKQAPDQPEKEEPAKQELTKQMTKILSDELATTVFQEIIKDIPKSDNTPKNTPSRRPRRKSLPKPIINLDQLNSYAIAAGNSAFKNQGANRPPTKEDLVILMYQERARKHLTVSVNSYANQANFYNINTASIELILIIGRKGEVLDVRTRNLSNNPAIPKLIEKIIQYAGLFPAIPEASKLQSFTLTTTITIAQGKLKSGYGWQ